MPKITFLPDNVTIEVQPGTTVFNAAARAEIAIPSQCGGKCACALCRVKVVEGEGLLSPMRWDEECHMGNAFFLTRERLSCQSQVFGDMTVEIADTPVKEKKRGRYIPHALVRKREKMEQEAEIARVRDDARPPRSGNRRPSKDDRAGAPSPRRSRGPAKDGPRSSAPSSPRPPRRGRGRPPADPVATGPASDAPVPPRPAEASPSRPDDAPPSAPPRRRRRRRSRNPGAPRSGDSRPPAGAKPDKT